MEAGRVRTGGHGDSVTPETMTAGAPAAPDDFWGLRDLLLLEFLYGSGCRVSEAVGLDVRGCGAGPRSRARTGQGQQGTGRVFRWRVPGVAGAVPAAARRPPARLARVIGPGCARGPARAVSQRPRRAAQRPQRAPHRHRGHGGGRHRQAHHPAQPAPFVRDPPAGRRSERSCGAGIAWSRKHFDHAGLHPYQSGAPARGASRCASARGPRNPTARHNINEGH